MARTQVAYAKILIERGVAEDKVRAQALLNEARDAIDSFGMTGLLLELCDLEQRARVVLEDSSRKFGSRATFRCDGDLWTVAWGGTTRRIRKMNGLVAIAHLLSKPNHEIHVAELCGIVDLQNGRRVDAKIETPILALVDRGDAGPMLDLTAKQAYRRRLRELREEAEEARSFHDEGRLDRALQEIEFLEAELSHAIGIGGRDRRSVSNSERMRVRLTNAIRSAIERVSENHSELGRHLEVSIRTGTLCSYRPDPRAATDWEL